MAKSEFVPEGYVTLADASQRIGDWGRLRQSLNLGNTEAVLLTDDGNEYPIPTQIWARNDTDQVRATGRLEFFPGKYGGHWTDTAGTLKGRVLVKLPQPDTVEITVHKIKSGSPMAPSAIEVQTDPYRTGAATPALQADARRGYEISNYIPDRYFSTGQALEAISQTRTESEIGKDEATNLLRGWLESGKLIAEALYESGKLEVIHSDYWRSKFALWTLKRGLMAGGNVFEQSRRRNDGTLKRLVLISKIELHKCLEPREAKMLPQDLMLDIARTGGQGRPTIMHLIQQELEARAARRELQPTLNGESSVLRQWAAANYKDVPIPTTKTIQNRLRRAYRQLADSQRPK